MNISKELNRCLGCINKPCMNNCPLNNNIPDIIKLLKDNKNKEAYQLLSSTTCLGSICGRVCPHSCMMKCTKGKIDNSIEIGEIEKYLSDLYLDDNYKLMKEKNNKKIAIIGSGPASLTCAYYLAINGYNVTIYERHKELGGLLRYGIPEFRLDRNILDKSINKIINLGIEVKLNCELGKDITLDELSSEYDSIFLGIGANSSRRMGFVGEDNNNVYGANELLEFRMHPDYTNKIVSVIGGGNVAIDAARTIKRMNAKKVYIIYRRTEKEMPALREEIDMAKKEGIEFIYQANVVKVEDNRIELVKTELVDKGDKRLSPVNIEGTNYELESDYVIKALGSIPNEMVSKLGLELNDNGYIKVNNYMTSKEGIFAGGEIIGNKGTVSSSAKDGRESALEIMEYVK